MSTNISIDYNNLSKEEKTIVDYLLADPLREVIIVEREDGWYCNQGKIDFEKIQLYLGQILHEENIDILLKQLEIKKSK